MEKLGLYTDEQVAYRFGISRVSATRIRNGKQVITESMEQHVKDVLKLDRLIKNKEQLTDRKVLF